MCGSNQLCLVKLSGCEQLTTWHILGASLSEPHTSVIAMAEVCVCLLAYGHIP